jgi:hypothetical protein
MALLIQADDDRSAKGIILDDRVTAETAAAYTGYNLLPLLDHNHVLLADEAQSVHLANVRGGLRLWRLCEAMGLS